MPVFMNKNANSYTIKLVQNRLSQVDTPVNQFKNL